MIVWISLILGCILTSPALSQWSCTTDQQCSDVTNSVCEAGACVCPRGKELVLGGTACVDLAPYHTSLCVEDHQCSRLFASFECRKGNTTVAEGYCACQTGFHYFHGRCWRTATFGSQCSQNEECLDEPRDPYSLVCEDTCKCAEGYYERQRGECRKIGYGVGDGCVLNSDCQFANGACDINTFMCIDSTATAQNELKTLTAKSTPVNVTSVKVTAYRSHGAACGASEPCADGFECFNNAVCLCPVGYYASNNGSVCYAELGSTSTPEQCVGLLAGVRDGLCTCPANFFFEENMRDCTKVARRMSDACVSDSSCRTFGAAAHCAPAREPWGLRACACDERRAVWDGDREMCRLFSGIGEECTVDSDCLAGELEIQCVSGKCSCPEGLVASDGLCLTTGLAIGEACQASLECTATANTVCAGGLCSCDGGYQEVDGSCAPVIGGACTQDSECVIPNTRCDGVTLTCQCVPGLVAHDDICWPVATGYEGQCNVTAQCVSLGDSGVCAAGACVCATGQHYRDGGCWPQTGLFEACSRTSECFLQPTSEVVVCRNSVCQCDFDHPYSDQLKTCERSSSASFAGSFTLILVVLTFLILS